MKSGMKLVIILVVVFVPLISLAIISINSQLPQTEEVPPAFLECLSGCPLSHIWVANVTGWNKLTVQITPSSIEANCLQTASGNITIRCTRYVEFSNDGQHWTPAKVTGTQTVCFGGGLNCICCLHDYITFPVYDPLTITFGIQGKYVGITGQSDTRVIVVASR